MKCDCRAFVGMWLMLAAAILVPKAAAAEQPAATVALQERVDNVLKRVQPAVVGIRHDQHRVGSGVVISSSGLVLSHGHHRYGPGDDLQVFFPDGKVVKANYELTYNSLKYDCALLQLTDAGPWPCVEISSVDQVQPGEWCLMMGHPRRYVPGRLPVPRMGVVIEVEESCFSASCMNVGNDSGSAIFDESGRVIGVNNGLRYITSEFPAFCCGPRSIRRALEEYEALAPTSRAMLKKRIDRQSLIPEWNSKWDAAAQATVKVNSDGKRSALGLIVDPAGLILTKLSQIRGQPSCLLQDGKTYDATMVASSPGNDLALLKIAANGLPVLPWPAENSLRNGLIVVIPEPGRKAAGQGIICDSRIQAIPAVEGLLQFDVEPAGNGLRVTKFADSSLATDVLKVGDILVRVDGAATTTPEELQQAHMARSRIAGDRVPATIVRDGRTLEVSLPWSAAAWGGDWELGDFNDRRTGFEAVFVHEAIIAPADCGGPLIDGDGRLLGMTIARSERYEALALPATVIAREAADMIGRAKGQSGE